MPPQKPITSTVNELMTTPVGKARQKAIHTLAKRRNMTLDDAKFHQAVRIAESYANKKK